MHEKESFYWSFVRPFGAENLAMKPKAKSPEQAAAKVLAAAVVSTFEDKRTAALCLLDTSSYAFTPLIGRYDLPDGLGSGRTKASDNGGLIVRAARSMAEGLTSPPSDMAQRTGHLYSIAFPRIFEAWENVRAQVYGKTAAAVRVEPLDPAGFITEFYINPPFPPEMEKWLETRKNVRHRYYDGWEFYYIPTEPDGTTVPRLLLSYGDPKEWTYVPTVHQVECTTGYGWYRYVGEK